MPGVRDSIIIGLLPCTNWSMAARDMDRTAPCDTDRAAETEIVSWVLALRPDGDAAGLADVARARVLPLAGAWRDAAPAARPCAGSSEIEMADVAINTDRKPDPFISCGSFRIPVRYRNDMRQGTQSVDIR
ncbi:hypothetical protein AA0614_1388 [Komagataeibacter saccharivorans NRIC 0614]|nr:hypothetical protein AA0614_1388 [Komagataeibacter saccharivorans NRIC 0614]